MESSIWSIERRHFQWPWTTPTHSLKVTLVFDAKYIRNSMTYKHNDIEILMGTYTRPTQPYHFEWHWVILIDLANIQWHEASRGLCDSWASCWKCADAVYPKLSQLVRACQMYCLPKLVRFVRHSVEGRWWWWNVRLLNEAGQLEFTCRVVHSRPLAMSAVQMFDADRMIVVSHLIGNDQLPSPRQVPRLHTTA